MALARLWRGFGDEGEMPVIFIRGLDRRLLIYNGIHGPTTAYGLVP